jgi:hypothetical protein
MLKDASISLGMTIHAWFGMARLIKNRQRGTMLKVDPGHGTRTMLIKHFKFLPINQWYTCQPE